MFSRFRSVFQFDILFFIFSFYLITKGMIRREESFLTAESGIGYMLGIVGGTMMLVLLLYPVRKHVKFLKSAGPVRYWFRIHMLLGVAGPVLILYHANFSLGSTNSNIALFCMLIVAGSGLFGRLFYTKIHDGLYGRKVELAELKNGLDDLKEYMHNSESVNASLVSVEKRMLKCRPALLAAFYMPFTHLYAAFMRHRLMAKIESVEIRRELEQYFKTLVRVSDFSAYERLFSLWHVLHIPLFMMMIISGIVHVIAVHIY